MPILYNIIIVRFHLATCLGKWQYRSLNEKFYFFVQKVNKLMNFVSFLTFLQMPNFDKTADNIKNFLTSQLDPYFFFFRRSKNSMIFSWSNFVFSPNQNPIMYGKIARKFSVRLLFLDVHRTQCTKREKSVQYQKFVHN